MFNENTRQNVLMIHGWGGNSFSDWQLYGWNEFLESINLNPVYVDILGHGSSSHPIDPNKYDDLANDIQKQISGIDTPFAIGFSLGGKILLEIAAREILRFRKIAICGLGNNVFLEEKLGSELADTLMNNKTHHIRMVNELAEYGKSNGNNTLSIASCLLRKPNPIINSDKLKNILSETLLICGDKDEIAYPFDELERSIGNCKSYTINDVNHLNLTKHPILKDITSNFFATKVN